MPPPVSRSRPGKPYYVRYMWRALIFLFAHKAKTGPPSQLVLEARSLEPCGDTHIYISQLSSLQRQAWGRSSKRNGVMKTNKMDLWEAMPINQFLSWALLSLSNVSNSIKPFCIQVSICPAGVAAWGFLASQQHSTVVYWLLHTKHPQFTLHAYTYRCLYAYRLLDKGIS